MLSDFELRRLRMTLCPHDQARLDNAIADSREEKSLRDLHDMRAIIELVAHIYHVTVKDILSKNRREHIVAARQVAAYVMRARWAAQGASHTRRSAGSCFATIQP
jgi:chromosomal replication initiation ATPase DnaA